MKQRTDGRWEKAKRLSGKVVHFYSYEKTEAKAQRDIERQIFEYKGRKKEEADKKIKFKVISAEWKEEKEEEITTWEKSYKYAFEEINERFGNQDIVDITPKNIVDYYAYLRRKKMGLKTVSNRKCLLNMIFRHALVCGVIKNNFIPSIPIPKGLKKVPRKMPTQTEIDIIKGNHSGNDFFFYFLVYTGLRISEACALTDKDFDFNKKLIKINKKITWVSNKPVVVPQTKTEAGRRDVPIIDAVEKFIPKFKGYLFSEDGGKSPLKQSQIRCYTQHYNSRHKTDITPHQLRHAFATLGVEAGLSLKELQYVMGHSDIHTTMDVYAEIRDKQKQEILSKLNVVNY